MRSSAALAVICTLIVSSCALPINHGEDTDEGAEIVKRGIYPQNTDAQLKNIAFQSLIGNLEQNLFETAISVGSLAYDEDAIVPPVTPTHVEHTHTKRHTESLREENTTEALPEPREIILQTTERIPAKDNQPAHIIIDRISVQQHHGGVPLIPRFEVTHTKHISATIKDNGSGNTTEISIIKTASTSASSVAGSSVQQQEQEHDSIDTSTKSEVSSTAATSTTTEVLPSTATEKAESNTAQTTTTTTTSTTAKTPKVRLEEAEKELKDKVAEIEAEPVILSARI